MALQALPQKPYWAIDLPLMLRSVYRTVGAHPPAEELMLIDLVEWLLRLPARSPRRVHRSWTLRHKVLTPLEIHGLDRLANGMRSGSDLSPFLGDATRTIRQRHKEIPKLGPTTKNRNWQPDWLFSDWGIHHFHLGPDLEAKGNKVLRSARVLFAYLTNSDAYLIDVMAHRRTDGGVAWADKTVLETLDREWPDVMAQFEMRGILPPARDNEFTSAEINSVRRSGGSPSVTVNGKVFIGPGLGLATDRSSSRAVRLSSDIRCELGQMEQLFRESPDNAKAHLFVSADASVGYFIPARNTAISYVPARTSNCRITWFFQRLLEEVPIFGRQSGDTIWLRPGVRMGGSPVDAKS